MEIDIDHTNLDRSGDGELVEEFYDFFQFFFLEEAVGCFLAESIKRRFVEIGQGEGFPAAGFLQKDTLYDPQKSGLIGIKIVLPDDEGIEGFCYLFLGGVRRRGAQDHLDELSEGPLLILGTPYLITIDLSL